MLWLAALLAGCPALEQGPDCEGVVRVEGTVVGEWLEDGSVLVSGTAVHPSGLAIHSLEVEGVEASNDGFNYDSWSAVLPVELIDELADSDGSFSAAAVAVDACANNTQLGTIELVPDAGPLPFVGSLQLSFALPGGEAYLPADGLTEATVTVVANAEAIALPVSFDAGLAELSATSGTFVSGEGGLASATVTLTSEFAQATVVIAAAGTQVASRSIVVAGPPTLLPNAASIERGEAYGVQVDDNGGRIDTCSAVGDLGAMSGGVDITTTPSATDTDGDGLIDLFITAPIDALPGESVTVTCVGALGQEAAGVYTVPELP